MNARQAIRLNIDMGEFICQRYLEDLTDTDLLVRPAPGANHINWQIGHLISSEHRQLCRVPGAASPPLPKGFAERYTKETAARNTAEAFHTKAELLAIWREQRDATLAALDRLSDADLDQPTGVDYAPTVASMLSLQGSHWTMHSGQWAIVRRLLGRPPLF